MLINTIRTNSAARRVLARQVASCAPRFISEPPTSRFDDDQQTSDAARLKEAAKDILDVDADGIAQGTKQFVENITQGVKGFAHDSQDALKHAAQRAAVRQVVDKARDTIKGAVHKAQDTVSHAAHDLASGEAYARAKQAAASAAERIRHAPDDLEEALHDRNKHNQPPAPSTSPPLKKHKDSGIEQERTL